MTSRPITSELPREYKRRCEIYAKGARSKADQAELDAIEKAIGVRRANELARSQASAYELKDTNRRKE